LTGTSVQQLVLEIAWSKVKVHIAWYSVYITTYTCVLLCSITWACASKRDLDCNATIVTTIVHESTRPWCSNMQSGPDCCTTTHTTCCVYMKCHSIQQPKPLQSIVHHTSYTTTTLSCKKKL
jgi:hypothetical protein